MKIEDIFEKPIRRPIETVIKADDTDHISDEVAEYVITKEISKKIGGLFQAYNSYAGANGVWISGFFGSGKSHLLKILSYVLENKEFDGYKSGDLFAEKIINNAILKADITATTRIPAESILFNIDQQAQITSKTDANAVLSVFYKVFFDHLDYYGFQPHVAEFEMWVDKKGQYEAFKEKFQQKHGKSWLDARHDYFDPDVTDDVAAVLAELNNSSPEKYETILEDIEDKTKQSIENFSLRVSEYIQSKPTGFRLNFFVDEVGQYISDNTKLMTNLQTVAESLATKSKGQAWIFVTSQEDMDKVMGDMNKKVKNDFSKIQARFKIKVPLTSANVDEVIEKRLLDKKEAPKKQLIEVFKKDNAHLDTLLSFSEAGRQFKKFKNAEDYANKFPFVPYQFDMFQQCRRALSAHNAFQGKHASVGERSMLGVFQQVILKICDRDERAIVSFDKMYEGIRNELRGEIQSSITMAENNIGRTAFAVKVLKALFMVKYFREFKPTKRNISVLMLDDVQVDLKKHDKEIEKALNTLENQSYIQRNGDNYEFLTDDEKDVEQEIKGTDIDDSAISQLLIEIIYGQIITENKIKYVENKQNYDFSFKVDGKLSGREKELEIEVISENYFDYDNQIGLQSNTMGSTGMKVILPSDATFMKDLKMYLRTDKYVRQAKKNKPEVKRIISEKGMQNATRKRNLVALANKLLSEAAIYMNGTKYEVGQSADGKTRIIKAFQDLIKTVYPNLRMLGSTVYSEDTIKSVIAGQADALFKSDDTTMSEAESEVLNYVTRRKNQSDRTNLLDLKNQLTRKPYGWYPNAIWTVAAKLYKRGKVELKQNGNLLEDRDALGALLNSNHYGTTLLEPQAIIDNKLVKALQTTYADAFDEKCPAKEAKEVGNAFKGKLKEMSVSVNQLLANKRAYPFLTSLEIFGENLDRWSRKEYAYFLNNRTEFEDELLDGKEDLYAPIQRFINGDQVKIYDKIREFLKGDTSNLSYVDSEERTVLETLINHPKPYSGSLIKDAKAAKDKLTKKVKALIDTEKSQAIQAVETAILDLKSKEEFSGLAIAQQQTLLQRLDKEIERLQGKRYIGLIRDTKHQVADTILPNLLNQMLTLANPPAEDAISGVSEPKVHYVRKSQIKVDYPKSELRTEADVEAYADALKAALKAEIKKNNRIFL